MIGLHFSSQQPLLPKTARPKHGGQARQSTTPPLRHKDGGQALQSARRTADKKHGGKSRQTDVGETLQNFSSKLFTFFDID